jgi:autotransporter-associated beta strand protein
LGGNLSISSTAFAAGLSGEGSVAGSLTLGATGRGATLSINPLTSGALTSAGALTLAEPGTVVSVNFSTPPASAGTYTVLNHGGTTATPANFTLGSAGYRPVTFDTTTDPTKVTMTTTADSLTWKGTTAVWDVNSTSNWKSGTLDPEKFYNLDSVLLDDTATNFAPTLAVTASPSSVTFNNSANDYTLTGAGGIAGAATLTKSGTSTVILSTTNTYTGAVTINGGTLRAGSASALGANTGGTTINSTGTLDLNAQNLGTEAITLAGGRIVSSSATVQQQAFTNLTVTANSVIGGTGRWDVRGATAISTVNSGVTLTKEDANLVYLGVNTGSQVINNGSIQVNAGTLGIWQSTITGSGSFTVNATGALAIEAAVDNTQAVTLAGGTLGNLTGSSASTQSGAVTLTANSNIASSAQAFNLTGGVSESGGSYGVTIPNGTVNFNSTGSFTGGLSVGPTAATASTVSLSSLTTAAGKEIRIGNTIANGLTSQTLNVSGTVANSGSLLVGRFGTLNINSGAAWTQGGSMTLAGQGGYTATLNLQSGASLESTGTGLISINGSSGNSGQALLNLGGTMTVSSGFTQTTVPTSGYGRISLIGGTLKLGADVAALTNQVQVVLGSGGGTIDTNGFNTALSGTVSAGTGGALAAGISGTGSLTKTGAGTLTLTGTNSYTGATLLNFGTLAGNGAAGSALTAAANTTLAPGVNIGTYAAAGATLAATSTLAVQIDSSTETADKLVSTAAVDITGASVTFAEIGSGTIPSGTKLVILDYTGTTLTGTFSGLAEGASVSVGANTFTLSYTDSSRVTLTSTTVASPYAGWATTNITNINPAAPAGFDDDADGDGYDNGLEWILGGSPLAQDASTLITATGSASGGLTLSFQRADESIGHASLFVEYDADLAGTWTSVNIEGVPPFANEVSVNVTPGTPEDTISVNIPASPNAPDGKLFGRIKATQP